MANILDNIRNYLRRPTQTQLQTLARAVASKKGVQISAMLQQQSDSLTKKDIADWRAANQMAIDYENPNRCGFMIFTPIASSTPTSPAVSPSARVRYCRKISASWIPTARKTPPPPNCCKVSGSPTFYPYV